MAIKLQSLYKAINNQFDVILHTNSFYDKEVTWIHTVEQGEFSHLLHGKMPKGFGSLSFLIIQHRN